MTQTTGTFKQNNTLDERTAESHRINLKYKDRVPIIVEISDSNNKELSLNKCKYLVPFDLTVSQFLYVIRKRIKLTPEIALFVFFNNSLPPSSETIGSVYKHHKDRDGFLYAVISLESTFG
jgi:GABA(A) receptor-associated protein